MVFKKHVIYEEREDDLLMFCILFNFKQNILAPALSLFLSLSPSFRSLPPRADSEDGHGNFVSEPIDKVLAVERPMFSLQEPPATDDEGLESAYLVDRGGMMSINVRWKAGPGLGLGGAPTGGVAVRQKTGKP